MEYRNPGAASHLGKGFITGVDSNVGIEHDGSTIISASDSAASGLTVRAKGTGTLNLGDSSNTVFINGSTTPWKVVMGESTVTAPDLAANAQGESSFAASGISTGDIVLSVDFRNTLSTLYLPGLPYVAAANKIHVPVGNVHASTISATTGVTVRWLYLDRT